MTVSHNYGSFFFSLALLFGAINVVHGQHTQFQKAGISYLKLSKPSRYEEGFTTYYYEVFFDEDIMGPGKEAVFRDVKRNHGLSLFHSWTHLFGNNGVEFGVNLDFLFLTNGYTLSFLDIGPQDPNFFDNQNDFFKLPDYRTTLVTTGIPVFYVHQFKLNESFTLFPKIGTTTRVMLGRNKGGAGDLSKNRKTTFDVEYITRLDEVSQNYTDFYTNILSTLGIGTSLHKELKNGNALSFDFMFSFQLPNNFILAKIDNVVYENETNGWDYFYSDDYYPETYYDSEGNLVVQSTSIPSYYAEHNLTGFSFGMSYVFGNK